MSDDYKVGYGKPPVKTKFQKGKSGNPSGRPKGKNPPQEPQDFQEALLAESKSMMTINEAGEKKDVMKWQALLKVAYALAMHDKDKGMLKYLLNLMAKIPKEALGDDKYYTYKVNKSHFDDLVQAVEQDAATWLANKGEDQPED